MNQQAKQSGQALVETLLASLALLSLISAVLAICYISALHIYTDYLMHEAIVCEETYSLSNLPKQCEAILRKSITQALINQRIKTLKWKRTKNTLSLFIEIDSLNFSRSARHYSLVKLPPAKYLKTLELPLHR